jgi:hypothetical protein
MPTISCYDLPELQLRVSPFQAGGISTCIREVNVDHDLIGALKKRSGYGTYLAPSGTSKVDALFNWTRNNGTQFWNYGLSGGTLFYSTQGTGAWTVCGNGTFSGASNIGNGILEDVMIVGDGINATRHSTNGTSFTDTTSAPIASEFIDYQGRMWAMGTGSNVFYSTVGTASNWVTDSSSLNIPGPGKLLSIFKNLDRLALTKNQGQMFKYDGYSLLDMTTSLGPTSSQSIGEVENFKFWLNRLGFFAYGGNSPEIISNPIRKQIYNDKGNGIAGTVFNNAPGGAYQYHYYCAVGTVTDDLTDETINNLTILYDYQLNEWHNYDFPVLPTAFLKYNDINGIEQFVFGDKNGNCYQLDGNALTDNGSAINAITEHVIHCGSPEVLKKWNYLWMFFNPGCNARVQVCFADTFIKGKKQWIDLGDVSSGYAEFKLPDEGRSRLMFLKVTESSKNSRFDWFGFSLNYDEISRS